MSSEPTQALTPGPEERYERLERIAAGGMGEVWRARDRVLGREVAVKYLRREYADDPTFRARFEAEARHTASVHHPGVASIFDYGVGDGVPFLVMELVPGRPLSDLLADGRPVEPEQARQVLQQAAAALGAAHRQGLVHRDVKPANLLLTPDGTVKVTDFGIARAADSVPMTQTGQVLGTPHYLSPEQARGEAATPASDVYALGVVLFECVAGRRPFDADTPVATALAHLQQDVPALPAGTPTDLARIVRRCLAKDPADRYPRGDELAGALAEARTGAGAPVEPVETADPGATRVLDTAEPPEGATRVIPAIPVAPPMAPVRERERRRRPVAWWWLAVPLVLLAALLLWHPWTGGGSTTGTATASGSPSSSASADRTVRVVGSDYVGKPLSEVEQDLRSLGLQPTSAADSGTVASVSPTGRVPVGRQVTVTVRSTAPSSSPTTQAPTTQAPATQAPGGPGKSGKPSKAPKAPKGPGAGGPGKGKGN